MSTPYNADYKLLQRICEELLEPRMIAGPFWSGVKARSPGRRHPHHATFTKKRRVHRKAEPQERSVRGCFGRQSAPGWWELDYNPEEKRA